MLRLFLLGCAGGAGTLARYWLTSFVHRFVGETFPLGTLAVNVVGCFAIGVVMQLVQERQLLSPDARCLIVVGLLGGFTTFSAFGYETLALAQRATPLLALINVAGNVVFGVVAVWLGILAARMLV